jgi:hypothetical protein
MTLVKHLYWNFTHIVFVEWFLIILSAKTKYGGLCGGVPVWCIEVEFEYVLGIGVSINYARSKSA